MKVNLSHIFTILLSWITTTSYLIVFLNHILSKLGKDRQKIDRRDCARTCYYAVLWKLRDVQCTLNVGIQFAVVHGILCPGNIYSILQELKWRLSFIITNPEPHISRSSISSRVPDDFFKILILKMTGMNLSSIICRKCYCDFCLSFVLVALHASPHILTLTGPLHLFPLTFHPISVTSSFLPTHTPVPSFHSFQELLGRYSRLWI